MAVIIWVVLAILLGLLIGLTITIMITKKKPETDYRSFFIIGLTWIPLGFILKNNVLWILGLAFLALGLVNKDKWKKPRSWNKLSKQERKAKTWVIMILGLLVLAGLAVFLIVALK